MNITKQEAQESLDEIQQIILKTRRAIHYAGTGAILIIWGIIWALGYSAAQFLNRFCGPIWIGLTILGTVATWIYSSRKWPGERNPNTLRIGLFWLVLMGYAVIWSWLLQPGGRQQAAFYATIAMFAYVVGGLWLGRFFVWLGLAVTALTVGGFFLLPAYFCLWMALAGGGALAASGLYILKAWK
jgi:hypothetical protein